MQETEHLVHFNKIFFCLIYFILLNNLNAQVYPDKKVDSLLQDGISNIILQNYELAKETFDYLNLKYPRLPLGNIYLASTEIAKAYDYESKFNSDYIELNLDSAEIKANRLLDKDDENPWYRYFAGLKNGYYAYYEALNKSWLSALSNGVNAIKDFDKCLKIDTSFYEVYTAIGAFQYWKSRKTEIIKWLPFVKDEKEQGVKNLQIAVANSKYNHYFAVNSLLWIYIDQRKFKEAIELSNKALEEYPGSRFFMWPLARAYEENYSRKAIDVYQQLLNSYSKLGKTNNFNEIVIKHIIAQQYIKLGENDIALEYLNQILNTKNLSKFVLDKLGDRLERVANLKKELSGK
ncbi:MAG TPA: hypothetical protein VKA26_01415 [Ignavibacteriaceae bacterium]|nr:hypothetical protein [Ignavibacteriaceae bacterium]